MRISDWSSDVCSSDLQPRQDGHFAAMPYDRVAAFIVTLRAKESFSRLALEFAILTASRSGEVRGATWDEFDLGLRLWTNPKHRMKAKREHVRSDGRSVGKECVMKCSTRCLPVHYKK